ncbi:WbqC family protein [Kitasatospora sp. NPDC127121]|uniref:WbqC family protein n=1 Tax=Kitasatospora sp. NPDC127121 TaxID=3345371 RepID=UPI00363ACB26
MRGPARHDVLVAHQPAYLPWPGYFSRLLDVDRLVLLDHVPYSERGWQNRNFVTGPLGERIRLTVPVTRVFGEPLAKALVADDRWRGRHWRTLREAYGRAAHWPGLEQRLLPIYEHPWTHLADLNQALLAVMLDAFGLEVRLERSSEIAPDGAKTAMLADLCRRTGTNVLRVGTGAADYLDTAWLTERGIGVEVATYHPPAAMRPSTGAAASALDLLAHHGPGALRLLEAGGRLHPQAPTIEETNA